MACQIKITAELDGMVVKIPHKSPPSWALIIKIVTNGIKVDKK